MKRLNEKNYSLGKNLKKSFVHLISWSVLWAQIASVPQAQAEDNIDVIPTTNVNIDSTVTEANQDRDQNQQHQTNSLQNGGTLSNCSADDLGSYTTFDTARNAYSNFTLANTQAIQNRISALNAQGSDLLAAQSQYAINHGGFVDPANPIDQTYDATRRRLQAARTNFNRIQREVLLAQAELNAAQAACNSGNNSFCSPQERSRISAAQTRLSTLNAQLRPAQNELRTAQRAYQNAPRNVTSTAPNAVADTSANSNAMTASHSVSGCGSNFNIETNTDTDCALSGPLFDADQELNRIANAGINEARQMAATSADALFDLELEQREEFSSDYRFYQLAVNAGIEGGENLNDIERLSDTDGRKTKNLKFTISNIKTMALASTSVKDVVCEQHDLSEIDSQATYIFKAASATWLMAIVKDTDYYSAESQCRQEEVLGADDNKNLQMVTVERAANVLNQQLENLCLRVGGKVDKDGDGVIDGTYLDPPLAGYDWRDYGDSEAQAENHVKVLRGYTDGELTYPPLRERCEEYIVNLRGEEFRDKPRTRETALEMMREAEGLALEELMGKMEKIKIAEAQVKKGEEWVAATQQKLAMMAVLLAVVSAAQANAQGTCAGCGPWCGFCCSMCPVAASLAMQAAWISGTVIAVWLFSELMRARSFLAKWRAKFHRAKHFAHLACNFETAYAEEVMMAELGEAAKVRKQEFIDQARQDAINGIINTVNEETISTTTDATTFNQKEIDNFNEQLKYVKTEKDIIHFLSQKIVGKNLKSWQALKKALAASGLDLVLSMGVNEAQAQSDLTQRLEGANEPASAASATHLQRRNVISNTNALNIAEGTESFRYFLVQRNGNFQFQTNDITNQPEHTRDDSKIANAGTSRKNVTGGIIRSIDELAQFHLDGNLLGGVVDGIIQVIPVQDLADNEKTGFPTPETRYLTIQNARKLFEENLELLNGGIAEVAYNLDQTVQLLTQMRRRLSLDDQGLGEVQLISGNAPSPVCMVGDVSDLNFDSSCGCSQENSCSSFEYPQFNPTTPNALKAGGRLSTDAANSLMSGNLSGAALNGGRLVANSAAVRKDLFERKKKLGLSSSSSDSSSTGNAQNSGGSGGNSLDRALEDKANSNLAKLGVDTRSGSAFSRARNALLGTSTADQAEIDRKAKALADAQNARSRSSRRNRAVVKDKLGNGSDSKKSENFSLTDGSGNLNLEGLTDEERARLGLGADGSSNKNGSGNVGPTDGSDKYAHVRNFSKGKSGKGKDSSGINHNRKRDIFKIISKRYEKTAFPVFLSP